MDKSTGLKPEHRRELPPGWVAQTSGFATIRTRTGFQGFRGCEMVLQYGFDWRYLYARIAASLGVDRR